MELTGRRGVDVVLNSLAGEAIPMGLSCLAEFGRFIEIGKRDIYQNSRIPLWPLRRNASFHVVAMDAVFSGDEELARATARGDRRIGRAGRALAAAVPLVSRRAASTRLSGSWRRANTSAKSWWPFPKPSFRDAANRLPPAFAVKHERLLSDHRSIRRLRQGAGRWLVECGARHLVLTSRSGAATPEAEAFVRRSSRARRGRARGQGGRRLA